MGARRGAAGVHAKGHWFGGLKEGSFSNIEQCTI